MPSRYSSRLTWSQENLKWSLDVLEAGRVIDGGYFPTKIAALRWFREHYSSVR